MPAERCHHGYVAVATAIDEGFEMADALKKAAVWLGLVSDNNYAGSEYGADDVTQQVPRDDDRQLGGRQQAINQRCRQ